MYPLELTLNFLPGKIGINSKSDNDDYLDIMELHNFVISSFIWF